MDVRAFLAQIGSREAEGGDAADESSNRSSDADEDDQPVVSIARKIDRSIVPAFRRRNNDELKGVVVSLLPQELHIYETQQPSVNSSGSSLRSGRSAFVLGALRHKRVRSSSADDCLGGETDHDGTERIRQPQPQECATLNVQSYISVDNHLKDQNDFDSGDDLPDSLTIQGTSSELRAKEPEHPPESSRAEPTLSVKENIPRRKGLLELAKGIAKAQPPPVSSSSWAPSSKSF